MDHKYQLPRGDDSVQANNLALVAFMLLGSDYHQVHAKHTLRCFLAAVFLSLAMCQGQEAKRYQGTLIYNMREEQQGGT